MRKLRESAALLSGVIGYYAVAIATDYLLVTQLGLASSPLRFALLGLAEFIFGGAAVVLALRLANLTVADVGWTSVQAGPDLALGLGIAVAFAALQFLVIIPATGGAERSDVAVAVGQIGETLPGLGGMLFLALFGSASEELLFRGMLLGGLAIVLGGGWIRRSIATMVTVLLFALGHGYQGWAGVIDTGLYGGLTLSLLYWWRGARLMAPVAAHVGWNVLASVIIFAGF
jgi:membrane protease YdiL (CAAX protease family)